jgi:hypothetical protein
MLGGNGWGLSGWRSLPQLLTCEGKMFKQTFKNIDDVLWKEAGCTTELDYTEQTSWLLFLKYLDDLEQEKAIEAELVGKPYVSREGQLNVG